MEESGEKKDLPAAPAAPGAAPAEPAAVDAAAITPPATPFAPASEARAVEPGVPPTEKPARPVTQAMITERSYVTPPPPGSDSPRPITVVTFDDEAKSSAPPATAPPGTAPPGTIPSGPPAAPPVATPSGLPAAAPVAARDAPPPTLDDAALAQVAAAPTPAPAPAPAAAGPSRKRLALLIAGGIGLGLVAGGALGYRPLLHLYIAHRAAGLGFDLEFDRAELNGKSVRLEGARVGLVGVRGMKIRAQVLRVELDGLSPASVGADNVTVSIEGSPFERILELGAWSSDHREAYRTPGSAGPIQVEWRTKAGQAAWLSASDGSLKSTGKGAKFHAASARLGGAAPSPMGASWSIDDKGIYLGLAKEQAAEPLLSVTLKTAQKPTVVDVTVRPLPLETMTAALGGTVSAKGATASGTAQLTLGEHAGTDPIVGRTQLVVDGWIPPHPKEANAVVNSKRTTVSAAINVPANRSLATLSDLKVENGSLKLRGGGTVEGAGDHVLAKLELKGALRCADLAHNAVPDMGPLNGIAGGLAGSAVGGNVTVTVNIDADSRDLKGMKMHPKVGVGCGLKLPF